MTTPTRKTNLLPPVPLAVQPKLQLSCSNAANLFYRRVGLYYQLIQGGNPVGVIAKVPATIFQQEVLKADPPVLVFFTVSGCQPCEELKPLLEKMARNFSDRLKVVQTDMASFDEASVTDELAETITKIRNVPTLPLYKRGRVMGKLNGEIADTLEKLEAKVNNLLAKIK